MLTPSLLLASGALLLWMSAEGLVRGAALLGKRAGISSIVVGLTVVSIGTSAPEFVVSATAVLEGRPDLALGNVLGSNLANIGLVLGGVALLRPQIMAPGVVRRDVPWMLAVTFLVLPLVLDLQLGRFEGGMLVAVLAIYLVVLVRTGRRGRFSAATNVGASLEKKQHSYVTPALLIMGGGVGLVVAGPLIVSGGSSLASELGISEMIIGLSVVAVGTSLPELATAVVAALRREGDLAIGNVLGSNIFNLTFVLGGVALIRPLSVPSGFLSLEYPPLAFLSLAIVPLAWTGGRLTRAEGALLLAAYGGAWVWILLRQGVPA